MGKSAKPLSERLNRDDVLNVMLEISDRIDIPLSFNEPLSRQITSDNINSLKEEISDKYEVPEDELKELDTIDEILDYVCIHGKPYREHEEDYHSRMSDRKVCDYIEDEQKNLIG